MGPRLGPLIDIGALTKDPAQPSSDFDASLHAEIGSFLTGRKMNERAEKQVRCFTQVPLSSASYFLPYRYFRILFGTSHTMRIGLFLGRKYVTERSLVEIACSILSFRPQIYIYILFPHSPVSAFHV